MSDVCTAEKYYGKYSIREILTHERLEAMGAEAC